MAHPGWRSKHRPRLRSDNGLATGNASEMNGCTHGHVARFTCPGVGRTISARRMRFLAAAPGHTESNMKPSFALSLLLLAGTLAFDASARIRNVTDPEAPRSLPEQGPVNVRWQDPAKFSEIRYSHNASESRRGNWVEALASHVRKYATPRLPAGERLDVEILDVELAGDYEPWRGIQFQDTRIVREIYPPRITLSFTRTGANGEVIAQGERKLVDHGFMMGANTSGLGSEPLRFEKTLLERWLARELPKPQQSYSKR